MKAKLNMIFDDGATQEFEFTGTKEEIESQITHELNEWDPMDHSISWYGVDEAVPGSDATDLGAVDWQQSYHRAEELRIAGRNDLNEALEVLMEYLPSIPAPDSICHVNITTQDKCPWCQSVIRKHAVLKKHKRI